MIIGTRTTHHRNLLQYNDGIPENTRFKTNSEEFDSFIKKLETPEGKEMIRKVKELTRLAEEGYYWFEVSLAFSNNLSNL